MIKSFTVGVIMLTMTGIGHAQTTVEKRDGAFEETKLLVESGDFTFLANSALSSAGSSTSLTTIDNFLKIKGNQIVAHLPFIGDSRLGTDYPGGGPKVIEGVASEYKTLINDQKRRITIKFSVKGKDELNRVTLVVTRGGFADLTLRSMDRTRIVYRGKIAPSVLGE